jgi:hypothetical protein
LGIEEHFSITPKASGRFERHNRTLSFVPSSLSPATLYTVKVNKGVKIKGTSETLKDDYVFQFETKNVDESQPQPLSFSRNFYEFSTTDNPSFDVMASVGNINVNVYKYSSETKFTSDFVIKQSFDNGLSISRNLLSPSG